MADHSPAKKICKPTLLGAIMGDTHHCGRRSCSEPGATRAREEKIHVWS